jgi:hypothetical protein
MDANHSLWDKIIPRAIAIIAFAYLLYALVWQDQELSYLHVVIFALVVALVLVPFARRLKIPSVIDFESKLESLREETRKEIGEIRNQISATLESHVTPIQHQWTVIGMEGPLVKKLAQSITKELQQTTQTKTRKDDKDTRNQFLRKADSYRASANYTLFLAHKMQRAIHDEQLPKGSPEHVLSVDERINDDVTSLLKEGVQLFVPPEKEGKTVEGLKAIKDLIEIRKKVDSGEEEPPSQKDTEELFAKVEDTIAGIMAGVTLQGWQAILYRNDMIKKLKELRKEFGIDDKTKS